MHGGATSGSSCLVWRCVTVRRANDWINAIGWMTTPRKTLGTYAGPVLIVTGKQDQIVGYEDQQALLPHYLNATFVTLYNAGHNAHIDQPEAVVALVREWVARLHV